MKMMIFSCVVLIFMVFGMMVLNLSVCIVCFVCELRKLIIDISVRIIMV